MNTVMDNDKLIRKRKNLVRQNATEHDELLLDNDPTMIPPSQSIKNKHKGKFKGRFSTLFSWLTFPDNSIDISSSDSRRTSNESCCTIYINKTASSSSSSLHKIYTGRTIILIYRIEHNICRTLLQFISSTCQLS